MKTITKNAHQLRKGDIVVQHGGRFEVTADPVLSSAHQVEGYWPNDSIGPSCCTAAEAVCIEGEMNGYFWPGSDWNMQGNTRALFTVEA